MYALAIDGELIGTGLASSEVLKALAARENVKAEVAAYDPSKGAWVPICLETLHKGE